MAVDVVRKAIKNLHLGVYPPYGRVRVAVPLTVKDEIVRLAVIDKWGWIKRQQAKFVGQVRQSKREMVSGESHYFMGKHYRLKVIERNQPPEAKIKNKSFIELYVRPNTTVEKREQVLQDWYRAQLKELVPEYLVKWQPVIGVQPVEWQIKKMKTKWGSCNIEARRIWFNLELAKKPVKCLEYILVHELVHLLERHHSDRFMGLMDRFMPNWRMHRDVLNQSPLAHEDWQY